MQSGSMSKLNGDHRGHRRLPRPPHLTLIPGDAEPRPTDTSGSAEAEVLRLLTSASWLLSSIDHRSGRAQFLPRGAPPSIAQLVDGALGFGRPDQAALAVVLAEMGATDDRERERLHRRVRREVRRQGGALPAWAGPPVQVAVPRIVEIVHPLRDADRIVLGVRLGEGDEVQELSVVVCVDHNLGDMVSDALVTAQPVTDCVAEMCARAELHGVEVRDIDPADARARITDAIIEGTRFGPDLLTLNWPACRPLVRWLCQLLPEGGQGYVPPTFDLDDRVELAARFLRSPYGRALDDADHRALLAHVLRYTIDYGSRDPFLWNPGTVHNCLVNFIPRAVTGDPAYLSKAPGLVRAVVRFAHQERGVPDDLTDLTVAVVDACEETFRLLIRDPDPLGRMFALGLARPSTTDLPTSILFPSEPRERALERIRRRSLRARWVEELRAVVGGDEALQWLDDHPLPDEPFSWSGVPGDVREAVADVVGRCDAYSDELADVEYRTACRRFIHRLATASPGTFHRRGSPATLAAAICWIVGEANRLIRSYRYQGGLVMRDLIEWHGVSRACTGRAVTILRDLGIDPDAFRRTVSLGSTEYLVAARRRAISQRRDAEQGPI